MRTDRLQQEQGVRIKWTVYPLHPDTPEQGMELAELFAGSGYDISAMQERLAQVAAQEGLPLSPRSRTYNSRRAQELGKLAEKLGVAEAYQKSVYRAYFVEGRNIGVVEELLDVAARGGIPEEEGRAALLEGTYREQVDLDWSRARVLGISGVPAYVYQRRVMVGFRPYQDLLTLIGQSSTR